MLRLDLVSSVAGCRGGRYGGKDIFMWKWTPRVRRYEGMEDGLVGSIVTIEEHHMGTVLLF